MPAPPFLRARGQNFLHHRQPPLPSPDIPICGQTVGVGEHTIHPGTSVQGPVPSLHVGGCVSACVPPPAPQHTCTPHSLQLHLPLSFLVHGNPDSHPCYSCYKRTQICHFTKNRGVLCTGHLPRTSDVRSELQSPVSVSLSGNIPVA